LRARDSRGRSGGVWLDAGELEQIQDTIGEGLTRALVQGIVIPG
jgi:Zn-finger nucleic acid-binding protein